MKERGLQKRTKLFALAIILFVKKLPNKQIYWKLGDQLLRAGTSVGANTRAAHRGRSDKEYLAKLGIVLEEADESLFWLEIFEEGSLCPNELVKEMQWLKTEAASLTAIFNSIIFKKKK